MFVLAFDSIISHILGCMVTDDKDNLNLSSNAYQSNVIGRYLLGILERHLIHIKQLCSFFSVMWVNGIISLSFLKSLNLISKSLITNLIAITYILFKIENNVL